MRMFWLGGRGEGRKKERKRLGCGQFYDNAPSGPVFEPATSRIHNMNIINLSGVSFLGINRHTSKAHRSIHVVPEQSAEFSARPPYTVMA